MAVGLGHGIWNVQTACMTLLMHECTTRGSPSDSFLPASRLDLTLSTKLVLWTGPLDVLE